MTCCQSACTCNSIKWSSLAGNTFVRDSAFICAAAIQSSGKWCLLLFIFRVTLLPPHSSTQIVTACYSLSVRSLRAARSSCKGEAGEKSGWTGEETGWAREFRRHCSRGEESYIRTHTHARACTHAHARTHAHTRAKLMEKRLEWKSKMISSSTLPPPDVSEGLMEPSVPPTLTGCLLPPT